MTTWQQALAQFGAGAEEAFDRVKGGLEERLGADRPLVVQPYRWYGTPDSLTVHGRVLRSNGLRRVQDNDTWWDNVLNTYRRFESDEVPYAALRAQAGSTTSDLVADEEGYFTGAVAATVSAETTAWHTVSLTPTNPAYAHPTMAEVLVPAPTARFGIISDIDDTVLQTHATHLLQAARLTLLQNAQTRLPFPGVATFYQALQRGGNPLFYVSSSPWNLYDLLTDFMALHDIPAGPLCLRDIGIDREKMLSSSHHEHKMHQITGIMETYPQLPFVLLGDSGQHDPEIYSEVATRWPDRVLAVYIRDVTQESRDAEVAALADHLAVPLLLVADTAAAAAHAAAQGFISAEAARDIRHRVDALTV